MRTKLLGWLLALPLALTVYGSFQYWRISDGLDTYHRVVEEIAETQQMINQTPDAQIAFDNKEVVPAKEYLASLKHSLTNNQGYILSIKARAYLSMTTALTGFIALLLGGLAMFLCNYSGRRARQSRDELLKAFVLCRKLLPFILSGQTTLIGLSIIGLMSYEVIWFISNFKMNAGAGKLLLLALAAIAFIAWYIIKGLFKLRQSFAMFESEPAEVYGQIISRTQAPALWQWIDGIAQKVGTQSPDNIIVGLTDCFYVTSHAITLNGKQAVEGKTLYFPLIYTAVLSHQEATAVIGHELGHFTGEDTTYSLNFAPIYSGLHQSIFNVVNQVEDHYSKLIMSSSIYLGLYFLEQFDFAVNHWSRIREFEADKVGASVSSTSAVSTSLLRISAVNEAIDAVFEQVYSGKLATDDLLASVMHTLREKGVADAQQFLEAATTHPSDSHPQTQQRITALGESTTPELLAIASRPIDESDYSTIEHLFTDAKQLSMELTAALLNTVTEHKEQYTENLKSIISEVNAPAEVMLAESRRLFWVMAVLGGFFCLVAIIAAITTMFSSPAMHAIWLGLLFGFVAYISRNRGKAPLLIFRNFQLESEYLAQPYPVYNIADYEITLSNGFYGVTFILAGDAQEPQFKKTNRYFKYQKAKKKIVIQMAGARIYQQKKLSLEELAEVVHKQIWAAYAQHELDKQ
ncbi:M48 family metallopeptidase [Pseudomonas sp. F1_0610]|uniref:M48 family metallopeptidase n=1 Tax=Pseudomonas sp. F1_0610 TaxID=3114284 RepID=UPI0039C21D9B